MHAEAAHVFLLVRSSSVAAAGTAFDIPPVRSKATREKQYDDDDQYDADDTDAAMAESVTISAEATTEATKQEDDEDDEKYEPERHDLSPVAAPNRTLSLSRPQGGFDSTGDEGHRVSARM
jgi:hypothetical protein